MTNSALTLFYVGCGGFIGAILRASMGLLFAKNPFLFGIPLSTLLVNISGSFLIGFILSLPFIGEHPYLKAFLTAGIMGGLTTFSTFSFDNLNLIEHKEYLKAFLNIFLNLFLALIFCYGGVLIGRLLK